MYKRQIRKCPRDDCGDCGSHNSVIAGVREVFDYSLENVLEWSVETIRRFQKADPVFKRLLELVPKGICPVRPELSLESKEMRQLIAQWSELVVRNGVLCRWKNGTMSRKVLQTVIPMAMRRDIMYYCHGHTTSGHFGKKRSLERLQRRYFWPGMAGELQRWIEGCPQCCKNKPGPGMGKMPLQQELFGIRFARIGIDIISGFKTTPRGNTCMFCLLYTSPSPRD